MTKTHVDELDVINHDGSTIGLSLAGTLLAFTAAALNAIVTAATKQTAQLLVADGAITVKSGVCTIAKTVAGVVSATLADPTATTDDYKVLTIINGQTQANTVTSATSFGGGGGGVDLATFANVVGNTLTLMAYQGKWYVIGQLGVTLS